jgi:DNA N-6-adenine-methyltransferase (Dam)
MKENDCLQTPDYVWQDLGPFDLDPCAGLNTNIGSINYRIEDGNDGLILPWQGYVFCNPPFSQKEVWAEKMIQHGNGILLLPERGSAPWFGPLAIECDGYFVMGKKINFIGGPSSNNLGSVLFAFGPTAVQRIHSSKLPGHYVQVCFYRSR